MGQRRVASTVLALVVWLCWGSSLALASPTTPPVPRTSGGPDGYGYTFIDSNDPGPGAPTFLFIDINASDTPRLIDRDGNSRLFLGRAATPTQLILTDDGEATVSMPFVIPFYTHGAYWWRVGNNGAMIFADTTGEVEPSNDCPLPSDDPPLFNARASVFWDDLDDDNGSVWVASYGPGMSCPHPDIPGSCFIVQWDRRDHKNGLDVNTGTFQVIVANDGNLLFQYLDVDFGDPALDNGASASVGIEDDGVNPAYVLEYQCNAGTLANNLAILWIRPPIPVELQSFTIE